MSTNLLRRGSRSALLIGTLSISIGLAGAQTPPPANTATAAATNAAPSTVDVARGNGYRVGYDQGEADANHNVAFNQTAGAAYQQANQGYHRELGDPDQYALNFRSGYSAGYDDGYHHHLYNSAMGPRALPPPPAAGGHSLPTDPAKLRILPSGVYDNGLLVALGTPVHAIVDTPLSTKTARVGDPFQATITVPIWVGAVAAIPAGSTIQGKVEQVKRGGAFSGSSKMQLLYTFITIPGQAPVALNAITNGVGAGAQSVDQNEGTVDGQNPNTGAHAATGAAVGGIFGGIFGGYGGLIRGGIAGAAAGTAGVLMSHDKDLILRSGEPISMRLEAPLVLPGKSGE